MVLCKHFRQGYCRFGSKCNFEHIDIKQLVKNDIESAINGKQYPFSCYGPFKDKPCIPNFIEDQCFEEVRLLCYEARQKNCFDQFHQQFTMGAAEAMNKMKTLLQPSYEVMNILTIIYDAPATSASGSTSTTNNNGTNSSIFGSNVSTDGGASSIFGKSATTVASTTGNVFGGSTNIFGGGNNTNNAMQQAGGIFGGQNTFSAQPQNSIFGQQTQQQQQQSNNGSIFGGVAKPTLFNQQQPTSGITGGGSGFGLFAQAAQQTAPIFNQQNTFGQQQQAQQQQQLQPQQSNGIFSQNTFSMQNMNSFSSAGQPPQPQTQSIFGQSGQMQQSMNQQHTAMGTGIFAQSMQQNNGGAPPQGFFQQAGNMMTTQNAQQLQQQQISAQQLTAQQQQTISQQPQDLSRNQNFPQGTAQSNIRDSVYSKLEDLTATEIEAFKADFFEPGKLPFSPPPVELLN